MRRFPSALCALLGLAAACASDRSGPPSNTDQRKLEAKESMQQGAAADADAGSPSARPDPCAAHGWYDDGVCDCWCPTRDPGGCDPSGGPVACAAFFAPADGFCDRTDPCGPVQDEDCQEPVPIPDGGIACTLIWKEPDGTCDPRDPCSKFQDADCQPDAGPVCTKIWKAPDGKCDLSDPCAKLQDADCQGPIACRDVRHPDNGICEAEPGCEGNDPVDCRPNACDLSLELPDGVCTERDLSHPCARPDPDCPIACAPVEPPDGKCTPRDLSGPCPRPDPDCPVACDGVLYPTNGVCEAESGCESSDPEDCPVGGPVCIEIQYATNGKCEAATGCEYTDPRDCRRSPPVPPCRAILYETNGICQASPGCESNDPVDCPIAIGCAALIDLPSDGLCPPDQPCDPDCADQPVRSP